MITHAHHHKSQCPRACLIQMYLGPIYVWICWSLLVCRCEDNSLVTLLRLCWKAFHLDPSLLRTGTYLCYVIVFTYLQRICNKSDLTLPLNKPIPTTYLFQPIPTNSNHSPFQPDYLQPAESSFPIPIPSPFQPAGFRIPTHSNHHPKLLTP